jgi:hypothetical protein
LFDITNKYINQAHSPPPQFFVAQTGLLNSGISGVSPLKPHLQTSNYTFSPLTKEQLMASSGPRLAESIITPRASVKDYYDQVLNSYELYQRERFLALKQGLAKIFNDLDSDEVIRTLREDPNSAGFAYQRMREVLDNALIAENEQQIQNLRGENLIMKEQLTKVNAKCS